MAQKASPSFQAVDMLVTLTPGYLVRMIIGGHSGYMRLIVTMIFGGDGGMMMMVIMKMACLRARYWSVIVVLPKCFIMVHDEMILVMIT